MNRRLSLSIGRSMDLTDYLLKSEAEVLYVKLTSFKTKQNKSYSVINIATINWQSLLNVKKLETLNDIIEYGYRVGYPKKLNL